MTAVLLVLLVLVAAWAATGFGKAFVFSGAFA